MSRPQASGLSRVVQIEPWIDQAELRQLERVIASTYLVEDELTREFEDLTRQLTGARHALAMCNGTMGLFACLKALGIGPGDEVIVPNLTFVATANAVILAGATPVPCEIREDTFCLDIFRAEHLRTQRTRAILPVHLYGQSADMTAVMSFARRHDLRVVEDAAQGVGVRFEGKHVGTFGDAGILSYYGNKTITTGEGGVLLTNDDALARAAYRLKNHGRDHKGVFLHESVGFNFSFTEMQAAVGISQMHKLPAVVAKKRIVRDRYVEELRDLEGLRPVAIDPRSEPVFWFTSFLSSDAEGLSEYLRGRHIQSRRFFHPLHQQPCYADGKTLRIIDSDFRTSEKIHRQGISLPSSYSLTEEQQSYVIEQVRRFHAGRN
jgi:perosamine synthetase